MNGYTKLFSSIIASTIWRESKDTKIVWITMLAMADKGGVVEASLPGLADMARVTLEEAIVAISALEAPDPYSRSTNDEGRRIAKVDGGWRIINHAKYREKLSKDERREYLREKQREHRASVNTVSTLVNNRQQMSTPSTQATTQATTEATAGRRRAAGAAPASGVQSDADWLSGLKADKAFEGIDVEREHAKMLRWCSEHQKQPTRRRFINWLNRSERPLSPPPLPAQRPTGPSSFIPT